MGVRQRLPLKRRRQGGRRASGGSTASQPIHFDHSSSESEGMRALEEILLPELSPSQDSPRSAESPFSILRHQEDPGRLSGGESSSDGKSYQSSPLPDAELRSAVLSLESLQCRESLLQDPLSESVFDPGPAIRDWTPDIHSYQDLLEAFRQQEAQILANGKRIMILQDQNHALRMGLQEAMVLNNQVRSWVLLLLLGKDLGSRHSAAMSLTSNPP